jgi:hypothetical protein
MTQNTMHREQPKPLQGREVIEEAARLLRQMRFSANRGATAKGRYVTVNIDPRWNTDHQTIAVLITCYALGHRRVDWEGLPVFVRPESSGEFGWIQFLNARGQAILPRLLQGDYRLSTSLQYGRSNEPVPLSKHAPGLAAAPDAVETAVQLEPHVYESADGRMRATVRQTRAGTTEVAFETNDESLAGATVRFAFVQESGKVELNAEVKLESVGGEQRLWENYWEGVVKLSEPCELVFEVLLRGE